MRPLLVVAACITSLVFLLFSSPIVSAETDVTCADLNGAEVFSQEAAQEYLGFFGSKFASDSIMNPIGSHGSNISSTSVRNPISRYGSSIGQYSAGNPLATKPPVIFRGQTFVAYLTANSLIGGGISLEQIDANCTFSASSPVTGPTPTPPPTLPPPPSPAWFTATDGEYTDVVVVQWAPVTGATQYTVGVQETPDGPVQFLAPTQSTSLTITNLTPGHTYTFGVTAEGPTGNSVFIFDTGYVANAVAQKSTLTIARAGSGAGTVTSIPAGVNCGSTCMYDFESGAQVKLTASATAGSTFMGWNGAGCSGISECLVIMSSAQNVTATFTLDAPPIDADQFDIYLPTISSNQD